MALRSRRPAAVLGLLAALVIVAGRVYPGVDAQRAGSARSVNWPLHNLDLAGSRFSAMDQINTVQRHVADAALAVPDTAIIDGVSNQTTPVVVDGAMYVTDPRGSVYALDAADGHLLWSFDVTNLIGGGAARGLRLPQPRRLLRGRRRVHGGRIVPLRARREDRETDPDVREERPGRA